MTPLREVHLFERVFSVAPPRVIQVEHIADWLVAHAKQAPACSRRVFRGEPSEATDISDDFDALMANDSPVYTVLELPGAVALPFLPYLQAAIAVYAVASALMASKPDMPDNVNRAQQSPNNALGARENQVRLQQRVEDMYGTNHSIATILMQPYYKYIDNLKVEYCYYAIGRGYYQVDQVKDGDTLISAIDGASCAIYKPFTSPNSGDAPIQQIGEAIIDRIPTVRRANEVDGITLKALNQVQLEPEGGYHLLPPGGADDVPTPPGSLRPVIPVPAASTDRVVQFRKRPNFRAVVTPGQTVDITVPDTTQTRTASMAVNGALRKYFDLGLSGSVEVFEHVGVGSTVTISGFSNAANNGVFTVESKPDARSITVTTGAQVDTAPDTGEPGVIAALLPGAPFSGTRTVLQVGDGWLILAGATFPYYRSDDPLYVEPMTDIVANNGLTDWTDWVTVSTLDRTEAWVNVVAPNGMLKDNGGQWETAVVFELQLQQLDGSLNPIGAVVTATGSVSGVTTEERAETLEVVTPWTGPMRTRMRRQTPYDYAFEGTVVDEIKWNDLYGVSPVTRPHFGNKTTFHTVTQANSRSTNVKQRQLNCIASRLIPKWTGSGFSGAFDADGRHISGTLYPTTQAHDIIAAVTIDRKIGNRPASDLDMAQMQVVMDQLYAIHPEAGTFSYTFDSDGTSYEETLEIIANAVFCKAYRQSGKIRLALDCKQVNNVTVFTHRNKEPQAEQITRTFANDASYDGVELVYQDPDTLQAETIRLPLDGSATRPKSLEIAGVRSFAQAWLRANREWNKIKGQRLTIETTCTTDARLLLPNSRVEIVDETRFKSYGGEVVGQAGLLLTLSQRVDFSTPGPHSIVLRRADGSLQGITVTTVDGMAPNQVLLQALPAQPIKTTHDRDGVRTIYSFASDDARLAQAWLTGEIDPPKDNYVTLRAVNYSDSYYAADTLPIPPKDSVIN